MMVPDGILPCIYEDMFLDDVRVVPAYGQMEKISLECQEDIDWDDIENGEIPKPILVANKCAEYTTYALDEYIEENDMNMYDDGFQTPYLSCRDDYRSATLCQKQYGNSLHHIWRESPLLDMIDESAESTQLDISQDESIGFSPASEEFTAENFSDENDAIVSYSNENMFDEIRYLQKGKSVSSSDTASNSCRGANVPDREDSNGSPTLDNQATHDNEDPRNYYASLRAVSPEMIRSPSPISSRSSSPRFLRSPSPLEILQQSFVAVPFNSSYDVIVHDDRYFIHTHSPVTTTADHEVPDIDLEYRTVVEQSEEFPSFRHYQRIRTPQSTCLDDQVVPDFIEE